jgi:DNA-binding response OmpR family regulator
MPGRLDKMPEKILIVEDEASLQETLAYNLKRLGYEVKTVGNGLDGIDQARRDHPDLILLDIMLPGMDGYEVCRILRQEMNSTIIFLTARDEEVDRVVGLEIGADDYMIKPFSMRELLARVKAHLRTNRLIRESVAAPKSEIVNENKLVSSENLILDLSRHEAQINGKIVSMKPREFELLSFFVQNRRRVLSRSYILERVWGWEFTGDGRTLDVHIRWLRKKIENDPTSPIRIVTVRGMGYRFEG